MTRPLFLYVPDVAARMGRSETSIRSAVARKSAWLPPPVRVGRRVAWFVINFEEFFAAQAKRRRAPPERM